MPLLSDEDFSVHADDCEAQSSGWMPISDLPDEVSDIDDLEWSCWDEFDSLWAAWNA